MLLQNGMPKSLKGKVIHCLYLVHQRKVDMKTRATDSVIWFRLRLAFTHQTKKKTERNRIHSVATVFVIRPTTEQAWHKAVLNVGPGAGLKPTRVQHCQKYLRPRQAPGNEPNPPKRVKYWGEGPLRPEENLMSRHTRPDPCRGEHARMRPKQLEKWGAKLLSYTLWQLFYFIVRIQWRHKALSFGGKGKEEVLLLLRFLREPSWPHSPTHSTVQYITIHPSPCGQQPGKYHICSMIKTYLKPQKWCMILFTIYDLFTMHVYNGDGRKTPKYTKRKPRKKFPVWLPALPSTKMEADYCPKTSRTYPRWDGGPSLAGQRNTGLGTVRAVKFQRMWIMYMWTFKIFNKSGLTLWQLLDMVKVFRIYG